MGAAATTASQSADPDHLDPESIGRELRAARLRAGWSQATCAARSRMSVTHLKNIEAGVIPKTGEAVRRLIEALEAELNEPPAEEPTE